MSGLSAYLGVMTSLQSEGVSLADVADRVSLHSASALIVPFVMLGHTVTVQNVSDLWQRLLSSIELVSALEGQQAHLVSRAECQRVVVEFLPEYPVHVTLQELYDRTGCDVHFGVSIADDDCGFRALYVSHETHPDMSVWDASYASACVPLLFETMTIDGYDVYDGDLACSLEDVDISIGLRPTVVDAHEVDHLFLAAVLNVSKRFVGRRPVSYTHLTLPTTWTV